MSRLFLLICGIWFLAGCGSQPIASTERHINADKNVSVAPENIPQPVRAIPLPPPPKPQPKTERYSVVVNNVPIQELLFALARDAKVNVDIHPGIEGRVSLNAIDQTLPQILTRLSKQTDLRFELDGPNLVVMPDTPYLKSYKVDYINMTRDTVETIALATQIASTGDSGAISGNQNSGGGNNSTTSVINTSKNRFWETLITNIKDILRETDKIIPKEAQATENSDRKKAIREKQKNLRDVESAVKGNQNNDLLKEQINNEQIDLFIDSLESARTTSSFREAASVIANPESGIISIRATSSQHEKIHEFLDKVIGSAKRQVLIEATIAEVSLSDDYQGGIDWSRLVNLGDGKIKITQSFLGANIATAPTFTLNYSNTNASNISSAIRLLSIFGTARVLSSPKIMVLNNQSAILKVVDNRVYFEVKSNTVANQTSTQTTFSTTAISVPIGFVMNVTPQIGDDDSVSINVRPTISRIIRFVRDPNPSLTAAGVINEVPEIQTREIESLLKVQSGQTAIMGGLMQDNVATFRQGVPGLSKIPIVGDAFSYRDDTTSKKELIIFLRPTIIRNADMNQDLKSFQDLLPDNRLMEPSDLKYLREKGYSRKP